MNSVFRFPAFLAGFALLLVSAPIMAESPFTDPGEEAATVVGSVGRIADYIYPVRFVQIDDTNIQPREVIWLKPGRYEVVVQAIVTNPPGMHSRRKRGGDGENRIELVLEAGKTYHVGLRYNTDDRRTPYTPVLHRVEDNE